MGESVGTPLPLSLRVVAWIFIVSGVVSIFEVVIALTQHRISLNLGALGIFVRPGLLQRSPTWGAIGVLMLGIPLGMLPVMLFCFFPPSGVFALTLAGRPQSTIGIAAVLPIASGIWIFMAWQLWVLCRVQTRLHFDPTRRWRELGE